MLRFWFYPAVAATLFVMTVLFIPQELYKRFFLYALVTAALPDVVLVPVLQNVLHIIKFTNSGVFNVFGLNFWGPVSWALLHMLFFRFMPERTAFLAVYVVAFTMLAEGFGLMLRNVGLFQASQSWFLSGYPLIFGAWFTAAALFFRRMERLRAEGRMAQAT